MTGLALALVHFIWQGALIGLAAAVLLRVVSTPTARYGIGVSALALMLAAVTTTVVTQISGGASAAPQPAVSTPGTMYLQSTKGDAPLTTGAPIAYSSGSPVEKAAAEPRTFSAASLLEVLQRPAAARAVVFAWLLGVAALTLRLTGAWAASLRLARVARQPLRAELDARVRCIADRLAIRRVVRIFDSAAASTPMIVGWLRPVVLLPVASLAGLSPLQVDALIAHELAHLRRHDPFVNLLQSVAETLLFYHPAVWWISDQIRREREHCCDDVALAVCGDRLTYAQALADLAAAQPVPSAALAASSGRLLERVARVLQTPPRRSWASVAAAPLLFVVIGAAGLVPVLADEHVGVRLPALVSPPTLESRVAPPELPDALPQPEAPSNPVEAAPSQALFTRTQSATGLLNVIEGRVIGPSGPVAHVAVRLLHQRLIAGHSYLMPLTAGQNTSDGRDFRQTDADGRFRFDNVGRGTFYLLALPEPFLYESYPFLKFPDSQSAPTGLAPTYFPSANRASAAAPIDVAMGETVSGITIALPAVEMGTVTGRIVDVSGQLHPTNGLTAIAMLAAAPGGELQPAIAMQSRNSSSPSFLFDHLPVGEYVTTIAPDRPIVVRAGEVTDVTGRQLASSDWTGRISFEGTAPKPMLPLGLDIVATDEIVKTVLGRKVLDTRSQFNTDSEFVAHIPSMRGVIRMQRTTPGWALKSVLLNGVDFTDTPYNYENLSGLEIVLTSRLGGAAGTLTGIATATSQAIAIFSDTEGQTAYPSRFTRLTVANEQGWFEFSDLLPGQYRALVAPRGRFVVSQPPNMPMISADVDIDWLNAHRSDAVPFTVTEGQTTAVNLSAQRP